jgi:hypothetical protein
MNDPDTALGLDLPAVGSGLLVGIRRGLTGPAVGSVQGDQGQSEDADVVS